jgi:hypothetical protein
MRPVALIAALALVVAACGGTEPLSSEDQARASAEMMAVALVELITVDHTFGQGPPPFTEYLIQSSLDPFAGDPTGGGRPTRSLTSTERAVIEAAIAPFGPVRWIDDPAEWRT